MNDIEHTNRQIHSTSNPPGGTQQKRRTQRQRSNPSPESRTPTIGVNRLAPLDLHQSVATSNKTSMHPTAPTTNSVVATSDVGKSNSLPGHQSSRSKITNHRLLDQQALNSSDSLNNTSGGGDNDLNNSPPSTLSRKKNLSTSDLDPIERKKQAALAKVEAKLEKAQRLHQTAQQSVEKEISDFLRITTIPNCNNEINSSRTANASFDKRIKTLQDTKKELEKKITNYQSDISRIQSGEIPYSYTSSKDIFSNIKSTAAKVASGSLKSRSSNINEQMINFQTPSTIEQTPFFYPESDSHYHHTSLSSTLTTAPTTTSTTGGSNNNQNSNLIESAQPPLTSSLTNEVGNSQFYIDSTHEHVYDGDKSSRKYDTNLPVDGSTIHENDKSPATNRRLTDDSIIESYDRTSDHSVDDRHTTNSSKRNTSVNLPTTTTDYQQLNTKIDSIQKIIDRYELKINDMQKQIDSLVVTNDTQHEQNERLNNELTDLTDLHQIEMSSLKTDLKNLEERLLYKFNDYWNELLEKLDKLDTRTAKVEQTQTHSLETEENTHRIISKLVNILLTVFAIILLLLSTIKNLVQSRVHATTLLILALAWITFHYLPPNYFHASFLKNFPNMFKRAS